jgi:hypothetical protein
MNGHLKLKPRVPRIQKLPKHGPVGVLKPCCIIIGGFTRRWDISARWPSRKNGLPIKKGSPQWFVDGLVGGSLGFAGEESAVIDGRLGSGAINLAA